MVFLHFSFFFFILSSIKMLKLHHEVFNVDTIVWKQKKKEQKKRENLIEALKTKSRFRTSRESGIFFFFFFFFYLDSEMLHAKYLLFFFLFTRRNNAVSIIISHSPFDYREIRLILTPKSSLSFLSVFSAWRENNGNFYSKK